MSDENERSVASDGSVADDPLSVCCRHLAHSQHIIEAKNAEIALLRLTDAERDFLQNLRNAYEELANQTGYVNAAAQKEAREHVALLECLLERHK